MCVYGFMSAYVYAYAYTVYMNISMYEYRVCHIIIHTMSHHHTYYVTSSYILCHIIIHTISMYEYRVCAAVPLVSYTPCVMYQYA